MPHYQTISDTLLRQLNEGMFSGASIEIGTAGGPLWRFQCGTALPEGAGPQIKETTLFDMASVSKVLSATAVCLRLFDDGILTPQDEMGLFYTGLRDEAAHISIERLLTHTSGLPGGQSIVGKDREHIDEEILKLPFSYTPGTQVQYACLGFILLGCLLEKVCGKTLDTLAREMVFEPLGMTHTGYRPQGADIAATAMDGSGIGTVNDYNARYLERPVGNAGVFSDAADCGKFAAMLLRKGAPILSGAVLLSANRNLTPWSTEARGWGFYRSRNRAKPVCDLCSETAFGHTGWTGPGILADPERGLYIALLMNRTCGRNGTYEAMWRSRRLVMNAAMAAMTKQ